MLNNYLKIAWRNIVKNKLYSFINIIGLTIGLWACMSVATVVIDDLSYDTQWSKGGQLYRILTKFNRGGENDKLAQTYTGMSAALQENFPEVEAVSGMYVHDLDLKFDKASSDVLQVASIHSDPAIWNVLDFTILAGTPKEFEAGKGNFIITESFRKKHFPSENPVGKIIYHVSPYVEEPLEFLITGVIADIPTNTHLRAEAIYLKPQWKESLGEPRQTFSNYYTVLKSGTNLDQFTAKVNDWYADLIKTENPVTFEFQPIKYVYLHSSFHQGQRVQSDLDTIYILCGIGFFLLAIACVNFINLTTAKTVHRMREIGVRKILGAGKRNVVFQFLTESILFFIISFALGLLLYIMLLPYIEDFLGHRLALTFISSEYLFVLVILILVPISLLVGVYPALAISRFTPVHAITGVLYPNQGIGRNVLQKGLVIFQFAISIVLLVVLIIVNQQVNYLNNKDIGYNKENLLAINFVLWGDKGKTFKEELLKRPDIKNASITNWLPTRGPGSFSFLVDDPVNLGKKIEIFHIQGDVDLAKTLGLGLREGRLFSDSFQNDKMPLEFFSLDRKEKEGSSEMLRSSLVTAHTARLLQIKEPNTKLKYTESVVVGIIDDFHSESLKKHLKPTMIVSEDSPEYGGMLIRVDPANRKETLAGIQQLWNEFYPNKVLGLNWVEDLLDKQYEAETKIMKVFIFFSLLSMFLAALGILGLVGHATARKIKEVGIRKVMGASINSIILLFSRSFLKLVGLAFLIAAPIAWYSASRWLQGFAFRIEIQWWFFILAGSITIFIVGITLFSQIIRSALANPVKSLRTE